MSGFSEYIGSQFGNPRGFAGQICCVVMNVINRKMYKKTVALINAKSDDKVMDIGYCGRLFTAYGNKKRKYCSHRCYIEHRYDKK